MKEPYRFGSLKKHRFKLIIWVKPELDLESVHKEIFASHSELT